MKILIKLLLLTIGFVFLANSCDHPIIKKDMVQFDKAFIPVLYYVYGGDSENAQSAVFFLNHRWQQFSNKYNNVFPEDDNWQEGIRRTNRWLEEAFVAIQKNDQQGAYIFLDHVRYEMMELRRRHQVDYFLDYVWDFEMTLDMINEAANDPMLCLLEWNEMEFLADEMNDYWMLLRDAPNDFPFFNLDNNQKQVLDTNSQSVQKALDEFNVSIETGEREIVAEAAKNLTKAYLEFLSCFGDFNASKIYFATTL